MYPNLYEMALLSLALLEQPQRTATPEFFPVSCGPMKPWPVGWALHTLWADMLLFPMFKFSPKTKKRLVVSSWHLRGSHTCIWP